MHDDAMLPYREHLLTERAKKVLTSGNTRSTLFIPPAPPYAVSGSGCIVTDNLNHQVIDLNNNYTAMIHGHSYEPINKVVIDQLSKGTAFGLPTESDIALAEVMATRTGIQYWRFSNSGTEALMTAIRGARAFTGRDIVIRFAGSYHGSHEVFVDPAAAGIPKATSQVVIALPQGDKTEFDRVMAEMGTQVAGVVLDLMPNRAGLVPADQGFVHHLREATLKYGSLLVIDEVITFRVGVGGMHKEYGIAPDLVSVGKVMGGGFPVGGVGGSQEIMSVFDPMKSGTVSLGGTFSANPVTMRAGKVAMDNFGLKDVERLNALGENLRAQLTEAGVKVSGFGSLARLHEDVDLNNLWWEMYSRGVLAGTTTLMSLSTPMNQGHIDEIVKVIQQSLEAVR